MKLVNHVHIHLFTFSFFVRRISLFVVVEGETHKENRRTGGATLIG